VPRIYDRVEPEVLARFDAAAKRNGGDLLLGVPYREAQDRYYNSVVTLGTAPRQIYHKVHLVAFGRVRAARLRPGCCRCCKSRCRISPAAAPSKLSSRSPASASRSTSATRTPSATKSRAGCPEATLLVNVSNVAWFGDSLAPSQHLQIARLRAIETGRMHLNRHQYRHHRRDRPRRTRARAAAAVCRRPARDRRPGLRRSDALCASSATGRRLVGALLALAIASLIAVAKRSR